jgi:hypothetical protein
VDEPGRGGESEAPSRAGVGTVAVAAILLTGVIAIVLASSQGSSEKAAARAPNSCLKAWNSDRHALEFGRHNSLSHGYSDVQVGYTPTEGGTTLSSSPNDGECAVVFAADQLDPEIEYAGEIHLDGEWLPLSSRVEGPDLAALQRAALDGANATVTPDGKLLRR